MNNLTPARTPPPIYSSGTVPDFNECKRGGYRLYEKEGETRLRYVPILGNQIIDVRIEQEEVIIVDDEYEFGTFEDVEEWLKLYEIPIYSPVRVPDLPWCVVFQDTFLVLRVKEDAVFEFSFFQGKGTEIISEGETFPTFNDFLIACTTGKNGARFPALPEGILIHIREKKEVEKGEFVLFQGKGATLFIKGVTPDGIIVVRELYAKQGLFVKEEESVVGPFTSLEAILFYLGIQDTLPNIYPYTASFVSRLPLDKQRSLEVPQKNSNWHILYREKKFSFTLQVEGQTYVFNLSQEGLLVSPFSEGKISFEELIPGNAFEKKWKPFLPVGASVHPSLLLFNAKTWAMGECRFARTEDELIVSYYPFGHKICIECSLVLEGEGFSYLGHQFSNWEDFLQLLQKSNLGQVRFFPRGKAPNQLEMGENYVTPGVDGYQYVVRISDQFIRRIEFSLADREQVIDCQKRKYSYFADFTSYQETSSAFRESFLSDQVVWSYRQAKEMCGTSSDLLFSLTYDQKPGVIVWKKSSHDIWIRWRVETSAEEKIKLFDGDAEAEVLYGEFLSFEEVLEAISHWEKSFTIVSEITEDALLGMQEEAPPTALIDNGDITERKEVVYTLQVDGQRKALILLLNTQFLVCSEGELKGQVFNDFDHLVEAVRAVPLEDQKNPLEDTLPSFDDTSSEDEHCLLPRGGPLPLDETLSFDDDSD